jgi:ubiquinone/menaquinone biosynthesis C-methylase UbiE
MVCTALYLHAGTGSGSLTHSLARAVAPSGHVYTFDFHALRAQEAAAEFKRHGLQQLITVQQRDIEEQGFPQVCCCVRIREVDVSEKGVCFCSVLGRGLCGVVAGGAGGGLGNCGWI